MLQADLLIMENKEKATLYINKYAVLVWTNMVKIHEYVTAAEFTRRWNFIESRLQMALVDRLEMVKLRLNLVMPVPMHPDHMNLEQRVTALVHNIQHSKFRYLYCLCTPLILIQIYILILGLYNTCANTCPASARLSYGHSPTHYFSIYACFN